MTLAPRSQGWELALELVRTRGYVRREEPFRLASGELSHDYIDGKFAVDDGASLRVVSEAMAELFADVAFSAVGGLTMGADCFSHGIAMVTGCRWFSVRKEPKDRGRSAWIEGARLGPEDRVLLVDDVISTGGSTVKAWDKVVETGAVVVGVSPMVDRGDFAAVTFAARGAEVAYRPLITYRDLGIEPVRGAG
jgi:orotate phosphoribosyltransferase